MRGAIVFQKGLVLVVSTTIPFLSDISISNLPLGESKVIKQNYT